MGLDVNEEFVLKSWLDLFNSLWVTEGKLEKEKRKQINSDAHSGPVLSNYWIIWNAFNNFMKIKFIRI